LFEGDRGSLVCDLDLAVAGVGSRLEAATSPSLRQLRAATVVELGRIMDDAAACRAHSSAVRDVLDQLRRPETVEAAWHDVLAAFADPATSNATCSLRIAQLVELVGLRGRDWAGFKDGLSQRVAKGALDEARELVIAAPPGNVEVAWVAFGNAHIRDGYRRVGQVQFFDKRYTPQDIRDGCTALRERPEFDPAPELTDEVIEWHFHEVEAEHYVLARVEMAGPRAKLPTAGTGRPIAWARRLVSEIVEAAGFLIGGTGWVLLDGGSIFTASGDRAGTLGFADPAVHKARKQFKVPRNELTAYALPELPPAFVDALAEDDATARHAAAELDWHRAAARVEEVAMRLSLRVRGFETQWVTGPGGEFASWENGVRHYLRDQWCWDQIIGALFDAITSIETPPHPLRLRGVKSTERLQAAFAEAWTTESGTYSTYTWKPGVALRLARRVAEDFVAGSIGRRRWRELDRAGRTGQAAQEWWSRRRRAFDVLLNRAVRQRNNIVHGQALVPDVVDSAEPFLATLSSGLVRRWIDAAAGGTTVEDAIETARARLLANFEKLQTEPSGLVLYPEA
jgi:hypothetical protein